MIKIDNFYFVVEDINKSINFYTKLFEKEPTNITIDNYLTKETTENISLAISKLNGELKLSKTPRERVYYFIKANAEFNIEGEIVFVNVRRSWRISKFYKEKFYRYGN